MHRVCRVQQVYTGIEQGDRRRERFIIKPAGAKIAGWQSLSGRSSQALYLAPSLALSCLYTAKPAARALQTWTIPIEMYLLLPLDPPCKACLPSYSCYLCVGYIVRIVIYVNMPNVTSYGYSRLTICLSTNHSKDLHVELLSKSSDSIIILESLSHLSEITFSLTQQTVHLESAGTLVLQTQKK